MFLHENYDIFYLFIMHFKSLKQAKRVCKLVNLVEGNRQKGMNIMTNEIGIIWYELGK